MMEEKKIEEKKIDIDAIPDKKLSISGSIRSISVIIGSIGTLVISIITGGIFVYNKFDNLSDISINQEKEIAEMKKNFENYKKSDGVLNTLNCIELFKQIDNFKEVSNQSQKKEK
jgi:hypothetical protein